jgi:hypothetical protein
VKPRLLDLFCGEGGAAVGYDRAGFEVVGVDIKPQPKYPFEFIQADAFDYLSGLHERPLETWYEAIHAAPLWYTAAAQTLASGSEGDHEEQLPRVREALAGVGLPWVLENATLDRGANSYLLCGASVGLEIVKHMWFTTSFPLIVPPCSHKHGGVADGTYVAFARGSSAARVRKGWRLPPRRTMGEYKDAADLGWMSYRGAALASPPAYTELIGTQLHTHLRQEVAA